MHSVRQSYASVFAYGSSQAREKPRALIAIAVASSGAFRSCASPEPQQPLAPLRALLSTTAASPVPGPPPRGPAPVEREEGLTGQFTLATGATPVAKGYKCLVGSEAMKISDTGVVMAVLPYSEDPGCLLEPDRRSRVANLRRLNGSAEASLVVLVSDVQAEDVFETD